MTDRFQKLVTAALHGSIAGRLSLVVWIILLGFVILSLFGVRFIYQYEDAHHASDRLLKQEATLQHFRHAIHQSIIQVDRIIYEHKEGSVAELLAANEKILAQFAQYQKFAEDFQLRNDIYLSTEYEPVVFQLRNDFYKAIALYREKKFAEARVVRREILEVRLKIIEAFSEISSRLRRLDLEDQVEKVALIKVRIYVFAVIIILSILLIVILVSILIFRSITKPLSNLANAMDNFDPGSARKSLNLSAGMFADDEVGRLGRSFQSMVRFITTNEQAREAILSQLEQKNSELERFTYTVSHDLKSPLVTVKGFLGLLKKDIEISDEKRIESDMQQIVSAADQMGQLLDDLLELSRIGRVIKKPEWFSLTDLANDVVFLLQGPIQNSGAEVEIAVDMPAVFADRRRIFEVIQNLIENSIKFCGENKPEISISAEQFSNHVLCRVSDSGIGIDPRYTDKVFELFDRLDTSVEGTGIGLSLIKRIIEVHHGKIWIESEGEGKGIQVCFTLPSSEEDIDGENNER